MKTSGADGIHVLVPIARRYGYDETYAFAELLSRRLEDEHPGRGDDRVAEAEARGVLVDHRQNGHGKTIASVYSVRPKPGRAGLDAAALGGADGGDPPARLHDGRWRSSALERHGDLCEPVLRGGQSLGAGAQSPAATRARVKNAGAEPILTRMRSAAPCDSRRPRTRRLLARSPARGRSSRPRRLRRRQRLRPRERGEHRLGAAGRSGRRGRARASQSRWPEFLASFRAGKLGLDHAVKVALPNSEGSSEHIWVSVTSIRRHHDQGQARQRPRRRPRRRLRRPGLRRAAAGRGLGRVPRRRARARRLQPRGDRRRRDAAARRSWRRLASPPCGRASSPGSRAAPAGESTSPSVGCVGTSGFATSTPKRFASTEPSAITFIGP